MTDPVPTTCMRCAVGCGHLQHAADVGQGIDRVSGDVSHPVSRGLACQRGVDESANPGGEWLTRPLVREDGELLPTTWDLALARVVERFSEALDRDPDAVAVLGSGQQTNEAAYALGKLARGGFGTRYYDANTTLCMASAVTAYYDAFGSDAPPPTYDDVPDAETHVVWGANPAVAHPVLFRWVTESAADGELVVVDPVETRTAEVADRHVALEPGTDLALARAVLARLVEREEIDESFVERATVGFDDLGETLPDAERAAATAGVDEATLDALATAFTRKTLCYWGMGVNQSTQGTATAGALVDLCLATGNLRPGSGPFSLTGQANSMGTRVCSSKGSWPGQRAFTAPDERRTVAEAWGVPVDRLPDDPGPGPVGVVEAVDDGPVEAVWTVATNPVAGLPDASRARERLADAFLVVQDAFRTETADLADVVLPAATWGESEGTTTNMERCVSRVRAAIEPPSGVRTDLEIIQRVGDALVPGLFEGRDPEGVFEELAALTAGTPADLSGVSYPRLDAEGAVRWPAPDARSAGGYRYYEREEGDERDENDERWSFPTPSGRARFSTGTHGGLAEPVDEEYPLTLTTGREPDGYNTGVRSRAADDGGVRGPERPTMRVHPTTLAALGEAGDEGLAVESRRASVTVDATPDEAVPEGVVWLPIHHPLTNELTLPATDPRSDEPNYKQCAVRLVAVEERRTATAPRRATGDD